MLSTTEINGVEIFSEGRHGEDYYTRNDLDSIIDTHGKLGFHGPPLTGEEMGCYMRRGACGGRGWPPEETERAAARQRPA